MPELQTVCSGLEQCCFIQKVKTAEEGEEEDPLHVFFFFSFFYIEAMRTHKQHEAN